MSQEAVSIKRQGPVIDLDMESSALGQIHFDMRALPEHEQTGSAQKLLAASALHCYTASLDRAMQTRGCPYESITGEAIVTAGKDEHNRGRILGIELNVTVQVSPEHRELFERIKNVMSKGCLVTASLATSFPVTYNLDMESI